MRESALVSRLGAVANASFVTILICLVIPFYAQTKIFIPLKDRAIEEITRLIDQTKTEINITANSSSSEALVEIRDLSIGITTFGNQHQADNERLKRQYSSQAMVDEVVYALPVRSNPETIPSTFPVLFLRYTESLDGNRPVNTTRTSRLRTNDPCGDGLIYIRAFDRTYLRKNLDHKTKTISPIFRHTSIVATRQGLPGNEQSEAKNDNIIFFSVQAVVVMIAFALPLIITVLWMIWNAETRELEAVYNLLYKNKKKDRSCVEYLANQLQKKMRKMRKWVIIQAGFLFANGSLLSCVALITLWRQTNPPRRFLIVLLGLQWLIIFLMFLTFQTFGPLRKLYELRKERLELEKGAIGSEGGNKG